MQNCLPICFMCIKSINFSKIKKKYQTFFVLILPLVVFSFGYTTLVYGQTTFTTPVYITASTTVTGALSKGSGTFVIDHPLDPANKLLYHSFVESPDVKNIYDGITTLDENGEAVVALPDYFEVLNKDYRFLLTALGVSAPNLFVQSDGVKDNHFTIVGGEPNMRVSWQVTGTRQDPYILEHPIIPEVDKGPDALKNIGEYLFKGYRE